MTTKKGMLAVILLVWGASGTVFSQVPADGITTSAFTDVNKETEEELLEINGSSWTFYLDAAERKCYIDFETISVNLDEIVVHHASGDQVHSAELWNLPVDSIYELDMQGWKPGKYMVSLRTMTGVIRRELYLAD